MYIIAKVNTTSEATCHFMARHFVLILEYLFLYQKIRCAVRLLERSENGCNELRARPRGRAIAVHLKNLTRTHRNMCALPLFSF